MSDFFSRDKSVISRHLRNVYREKELDEKSTVAKWNRLPLMNPLFEIIWEANREI